ncbi:DUF11 domain-containing protein [Ramlibacter sp. 2FC]|uniref:DUF11 domain-containing protein n=1 Tax=Ramlibacter sp. 2FC TaxID=2502188 RepID=UPI0010F5D3B7|nr:DUF11 domain-containing protein [Ramlibacter sp. 2FC]
MSHPFLLGLALAAAALAPHQALAQPGNEPALAAELTARRVLPATGGAELLHSAEQARPGELLEYRVNYRNPGPAPVRQAVATLPIPAGTVFVPGSALPAMAQASTDGRQFQALPLRHWVTLPDGRREQRLVPPQDYRALRWQLGDLASGQAVSVSARVRLEAATAAEGRAP